MWSRAPGLLLVCGIGACQASPDEPSAAAPTLGVADAEEEEDVGPPYVPTESSPRWSADDVQAQLEAHLATAVPGLVQLHDAYLWIMGNGDADCPGSETQLIAVDPERGCTSESGFWYFGFANYEVREDEGLSGWVVAGDFELETSEGDRLSCGGHVGIDSLTDAQVRAGTLLGSWRWSAASDSLGAPISASLFIEQQMDESGGVVESSRLQGGLTTEAGSWSFDDFLVASSCPEGPSGLVRLYDSRRGHWYMLELEGDCSGCGVVRFGDGSRLGRVCPDWSGLFEGLASSLGAP